MTLSSKNSISFEEAILKAHGAVKKVPGEVAPLGRLDHERAFEKEIRNKSLPQLREMLERQEAILENQNLLRKLPDKGVKVKERKERIKALIEERSRGVKEAEELLSALSLSSGSTSAVGRIDSEEMEWKFGGGHLFRKLDPTSANKKEDLDSDDDSDSEESRNPLKILAEKEVPAKIVVDTTSNEKSENFHSEHLAAMADHVKAKERFAPFRSTEVKAAAKKPSSIGLQRTNKPDRPIKARQVEVMPLPKDNYSCSSVKMVSLKESLELEQLTSKKLKELELQHAMERLGAAVGFRMKSVDLSEMEKMSYRVQVEEEEDDSSGSDNDQVTFDETEH